MRWLLLCAALLSGIAQAAQVSIAWDTVPGATGYVVSYGTASGSYAANVDAGSQTALTVSNLTSGVTYYFAVRAHDATQVSSYSSEVSVRTPAPPCARGKSGKACK